MSFKDVLFPRYSFSKSNIRYIHTFYRLHYLGSDTMMVKMSPHKRIVVYGGKTLSQQDMFNAARHVAD